MIATAAAVESGITLPTKTGPTALTYLQAHASDACSAAGKCGELIQAVVAARGNPHAFAGKDLVSLLQAQYSSATGAFGDGQAFTQALAVQGLVAAGAPIPAAAIAYIVKAQDSDGGWDFLNKPNDTNPKDQATSDTNSTAMELMALDAAGNHTRDNAAMLWLVRQADPDGGFPYQRGAGSDPDSTALVIQAERAVVGSSRSAGGSDPALAYLERAQASNGGYAFPGNPKPDAFTTSQVPLALLGRPFPFKPQTLTTLVPDAPAGGGFPAVAVVVVALVVLLGGGLVLVRRR